MKRLLVLSRDLDLIEHFCQLLENDGIEVIGADTVSMCFDILRVNHVDALVAPFDQGIPDKVKFVKEVAKYKLKLPIIFLVDFVDEKAQGHLSSMHSHFLPRPFRRSDFLALFNRLHPPLD